MQTKNSQKLYERSEKCLVGGVNSPVRAFKSVNGNPLFISEAKGSKIIDADGNKFIDYVLSWGPLILGHTNKSVNKAVIKQLAKGTSYGFSTRLEIQLAELIKNAFSSLDKIRFVSSGTEAVMSALRVARGKTKKNKIIKFIGCYHGHSDALLIKAGSGATTLGTPDSAGVPEDFVKNTILFNYNDSESLQKYLQENKDIAAIILEPIAGNMGVILPRDEFLKIIFSNAEKDGYLVIFDEVITGFRFCFGGAQNYFKVKPHLTTLGKIIGGGFPVGAYGGQKEIMDLVSPVGDVYQAGTLSGNPIAMTAGISTLNQLKEKDKQGEYKKLINKTEYLVKEISKQAKKNNIEININYFGTMFTIFFTKNKVVDYNSAKNCDTKKYAKFFNLLLPKGILFPPSQFEACFLSFCHNNKDIEKTLKAIRTVFKEM